MSIRAVGDVAPVQVSASPGRSAVTEVTQRVDYRHLIGIFSRRVELVSLVVGIITPLHSLCLSAGCSTAFPKQLMEGGGCL